MLVHNHSDDTNSITSVPFQHVPVAELPTHHFVRLTPLSDGAAGTAQLTGIHDGSAQVRFILVEVFAFSESRKGMINVEYLKATRE